MHRPLNHRPPTAHSLLPYPVSALPCRSLALAPAVALALAAGTAACGSGGPSASGVVVRDSAGITIVENAAPLWGEEEAWRVDPEPAIDIGVLEGNPEDQLYQVRDAARLSDGRIVVANGGTAELRYYDAAGRHLLSTGGEGGGPGEFQWLGRLHRFAGDSILAEDWSGDRLSLFDANGAFVRSSDAPRPVGFLGDGTYIRTEMIRPDAPSTGSDMRRDPVAVIRNAANGSVLDTLAEFPGTEYRSQTERSGNRVMIYNMRVPFGHQFDVAVAGDRIYAGAGDDWEVRMLAPDGSLRGLVRLAREARPVTPEHVDAFREQVRTQAVSDNIRRQYERFLAEVEFPETMPAYGELVADTEGRLWVRHYPIPLEPTSQWDVFDADGRWLGTVETPGGFEVYEIGSDYLLGLWKDDLGVEHVRLHRIEKPS